MLNFYNETFTLDQDLNSSSAKLIKLDRNSRDGGGVACYV